MKRQVKIAYDYVDWRKSSVVTLTMQGVPGHMPQRMALVMRGGSAIFTEPATIVALETLGHMLFDLAHEIRTSERPGASHDIEGLLTCDVTITPPKAVEPPPVQT